ncbi:long-chain fatty acid--CoA ligase [Streptomyces sp. DSM 44917]|uniref:Long-chain fatty acid--CoA ligase n=1 Tax=Streptomyces boetiae TaxID=3075541 RepID=A0ABU2L7C7_9ACTN|nr:long-chain fatty acid--CoA ligase [Streptomyces sp. DSM 44917]MDT0307474.1 long-chain fatty acid--CoA ligase [Streptomyces sp. DSM 44917]
MTEKQYSLNNRPPSVAHLFLERVASTPDRIAFRYPVVTEGEGPDDWSHSWTWAQTAERVYAVAAGLMDLGIRPEDRVGIASATRVEWILADLGVMCAGAATTTVYAQTDAEETAYILSDSGSRVLFAEDAAQLAKVRERRSELPELSHVVVLDAADAVAAEGDPEGWVLSLDELSERGATYLEKNPDCVTETIAGLRGDQLATLIYTSGTTGRPKGVRLSQDTWSYMGLAVRQIDLIAEDDDQFLWLPLAHVFGKMLLSSHIVIGHVMSVDGRVDKIIDNLPVVRPTAMCSVPRIFERVYNGVANRAREAGGARYRIFTWAVGVAREYARTAQESYRRTGKESVPAGLALKHAVADRLVYRKLRAAFGGRLRGFVSGAAPLSPDIAYFFCGAGLPILEGYGLTESAAASAVNPWQGYRTGTIGKPLPGNEVRIAEDGEILMRGPGIMQGYHNQPEKTAEVLEPDGWFHTGDIGELSDDGYLRITDRKKDLFKTDGGKYVAPSEIEGQFKAVCPFVSAMVIVGAGRKFCSALIALDEAAIMSWAQQNEVPGTYAEVVAHERTRALIDGYVQELNGSLQRWQTVKKFQLLPRELDVEHGDLTPSLKLKRPVVEREFSGLIEEMYDPA